MIHDAMVANQALLYAAMSGAGADFMHRICRTPGASKYLVGFTMPYARDRLRDFIGRPIDGSCCSREVAIDMATASYVEACTHQHAHGNKGFPFPIGVGVSGAIASSRMPRGAQRAHIVVITESRCLHRELNFFKETGSAARADQDAIISNTLEDMLIESMGRATFEFEDIGRLVASRFFEFPSFEINGARGEKTCFGNYVPATLNPLHAGHRALAESGLASRYLVTANPPHKADLSVPQMLDKVGQVRADALRTGESRAIEFSRDDSLFVTKAYQRPGSTFIIGADAMQAMLDPKWGVATLAVLLSLEANGAHFLVMGREVGERFLTAGDIDVPSEFRSLFEPIEGDYRVSSTQLRGEQHVACL